MWSVNAAKNATGRRSVFDVCTSGWGHVPGHGVFVAFLLAQEMNGKSASTLASLVLF